MAKSFSDSPVTSSYSSNRAPSTSVGEVSIPGRGRNQLGFRNNRTIESSSCSIVTHFNPVTAVTPCRTPASVRTRTPASTSSFQSSRTSHVLMAIVEGRGMARGEIGIASIDLSGLVLKVSQFADCQGYLKLISKLEIEQPATVLLPHTLFRDGEKTNILMATITENVRGNIEPIQRRYFSDSQGLTLLKHHCIPESLACAQLQLQNKYYALAASCALLKYIEHFESVSFTTGSLKIQFVGCDEVMFIDSRTAKYLELVENLVDPEGDKTLYGVLNNTYTIGGMRLLRENILQPPFDQETPNARLEAIAELTSAGNEEKLANLTAVLSHWPDVERVIALFVHKPNKETKKTMEYRLNQFIVLQEIMNNVPALLASLKRCDSMLFKAGCIVLMGGEDSNEDSYVGPFDQLKRQLDTILDEGFRCSRKASLAQKTFIVKQCVDQMLDIQRDAYEKIIEDIKTHVEELSNRYKLPLRLSFNVVRGYHLQLPASAVNQRRKNSYTTRVSGFSSTSNGGPTSVNAVSPAPSSVTSSGLPDEFIKVARWRGVISCTTNYMVALNHRAQSMEKAILGLVNNILLVLTDQIRSQVCHLYRLAETVARIDLIVALAVTSLNDQYVKPSFENMMVLKNSKHPILAHFKQGTVANDVFAEPGSNFSLITGPNMSGKSTLLRQIALIQIMAQIGCFVPAEQAILRLTNRLFARLDINDDIEANMSSFMLEVREMSYILENITPYSLVIVDEFGRATSPDEGFGISFAVCEELLMSSAFTFFATHFVDLSLLTSMYPNVRSHCFDLESSTPASGSVSRFTVTHRLKPGLVQTPHYGLKLLETTKLPIEIIEEARKHAHHLDAKSIRQRRVMEQSNNRQVEKVRLALELMQIARSVEVHIRRNDPNAIPCDVIRARFDRLKQIFGPLI